MSTTTQPASMKQPRVKYHSYPAWCPRFWHGMALGDWLQLLASNGFRIHPLRMPTAASITFFSVFNSAMRVAQNLTHGQRIEQTQIQQPLLFILGHWRSGTTYLHELLVLDPRLSYPTTYQCFAPHHFLLTEWAMVRFGGFLIPKKRPMDNVISGWNRPQEDEFALCNMGAISPYRRMAFPNEPPLLEALDMEGVTPRQLERWKDSLVRFVKAVTLRTGKGLVMKSPPHTGRLQLLAEMFPQARFVHIVRDPYVIFPSTRKLWLSLDDIQGLQRPHERDLDEYIFTAFDRMYHGFESQRSSVDSGRLFEVRYEDLVQDPVGQLQLLYERLELGDFEPMRDRLQQHLSGQSEYQTNQYDLDDALQREIRRRWGWFFERYGY